MKITIKKEEYKQMHNLKQASILEYNNELCIVAENKTLVGLSTGNIYKKHPTTKILVDIKRKTKDVGDIVPGEFFILDNELYLMLDSTHRYGDTYNFHTDEFITFYDNKEVEFIEDKNIQIKVK